MIDNYQLREAEALLKRIEQSLAADNAKLEDLKELDKEGLEEFLECEVNHYNPIVTDIVRAKLKQYMTA